MLETGLLQLVEIEYCDSDVVDIIDLVLQSYQILIISCYLLVRYLSVIIRCSCSEFT